MNPFVKFDVNNSMIHYSISLHTFNDNWEYSLRLYRADSMKFWRPTSDFQSLNNVCPSEVFSWLWLSEFSEGGYSEIFHKLVFQVYLGHIAWHSNHFEPVCNSLFSHSGFPAKKQMPCSACLCLKIAWVYKTKVLTIKKYLKWKEYFLAIWIQKLQR